MSDIRFVPMQVADLPDVLSVENRAYAIPWREQHFLDCLKGAYRCELLFDSSDDWIGYWVLQEIIDELHILNICIHPDLQGQGLGKRALSTLLAQAQDTGFSRVLLEVRSSNKAARRLYRHMAFQQIGLRKNYYPAYESGYEDALVLERILD